MDVAQGTPGTPSEGGPEVVETPLTSRTWEARLAEARARRDKILADAPRSQTGLGPRPWEKSPAYPDQSGPGAGPDSAEGLMAALPPLRRRAIEDRLARLGKTTPESAARQAAPAAPRREEERRDPATTAAEAQRVLVLSSRQQRPVADPPDPDLPSRPAGPTGKPGAAVADGLTRAIRALSSSETSPGPGPARPGPPRPSAATAQAAVDVVVRLPPRGMVAGGWPSAGETPDTTAWRGSIGQQDGAMSDTIGTGAELFRGLSARSMYDGTAVAADRARRITPLSVAIGFSVGVAIGLGLTLAARLLPGGLAGVPHAMPEAVPAATAPVTEQTNLPATGPASPSAVRSAEVQGVAGEVAVPGLAVAAPDPAPALWTLAPVPVVPSGAAGEGSAAGAGTGAVAGAEAAPQPLRIAAAMPAPAALMADPVPLAPDPDPQVGGHGPVALAAVRALPPAAMADAAVGKPVTLPGTLPGTLPPPAPGTLLAWAVPALAAGAGLSPDAAPVAAGLVSAPRPAAFPAPAPLAGAGSAAGDGPGLPELPGHRLPRPPARAAALLSPPAPRPDEPDLAPARLTAAPPAAFGGIRLRLMVPPGLSARAERALTGKLETAGFADPDRRGVDLVIREDQVRYYAPADREAAVAAGLALGARVRDFTGSGSGKPPGVIEVWLKNVADARAAQKPAAPKAAKAKKPKPVLAAPQGSPLEQALRDQIIAKLRARKP